MPNLVSPHSLSLVALAAFLLAPLSGNAAAQTATLSAQRFLADHPTLTVPAQPDRVLPGASMAERTQFPGHVAPFAKTAAQIGAPAADSPLHLTALLNRSPEVQAAFEDLLAKQQDPGSPLYHQWLTPVQVGALYGPTQNDVDAVLSWLAASGFSVESIDPSRTRIHFTTTFGAAASALKTSFATYAVGTDSLYSVSEEPSLPTALAGVLGSVVGLSQVRVFPASVKRTIDPSYVLPNSSAAKPAFTYGSNATHYLAPGDFNTIYDLTSVLNAGYTGSGQRIAIIGQSQVNSADITRYETLFGLPSKVPNVVIPSNGSNPGVVSNGDQDEQTLDVERVVATSPGATVDLIVSKQVGNNSGLGIALDWNVNTLVDKVMSISYGTCEAEYAAADAASDDSYFSQAAVEGITTLISSGDSGVQGCLGINSSLITTPSINGLCGSQYVTCIGGTEFSEGSSSAYWSSANGANLTSALGYIPEGAWNDPSYVNSSGVTVYQAASSGGGPSKYIAKAAWQTGIGVPADGKRDVPDISFTSSANHDGYLICINTSATCSTSDGLSVFGGTSAAAPGMAGIVAILNQRTGTTSGYGNLNPLLYSLAANNAYAFHDTTVTTSAVSSCTASTPSFCNNSTPSTNSLSGGIPGYLLTAGYDLVTGLGSLDVANFLSAAISSATASYTLAANPSTITLQPGATSATSTVTVAGSGTFTGIVSLTCATSRASGSVAGTCSVTPSTVALSAGVSLPATATVAGITGSGMLVATVTGTSGAITRTATVVANVVVPTFTLAPSSSALSLSAGATSGNANVFTVTSSNGYAGAVNLTCSVAIASGTATVLPVCSLGSSTVTLASGGSATSTATISTSAASSTCVSSTVPPANGSRTLEITLAGLLFLVMPFRKRRGVRGLSALAITALGLTALSGCGSGGSTGGGGTTCTTSIIAGTTKGIYVVTVTGTGTSTGSSSSVTNSNVFTLTVN